MLPVQPGGGSQRDLRPLRDGKNRTDTIDEKERKTTWRAAWESTSELLHLSSLQTTWTWRPCWSAPPWRGCAAPPGWRPHPRSCTTLVLMHRVHTPAERRARPLKLTSDRNHAESSGCCGAHLAPESCGRCFHTLLAWFAAGHSHNAVASLELWLYQIIKRSDSVDVNIQRSSLEFPLWRGVIPLSGAINYMFRSPSDICRPLRAGFQSCGAEPPAGSCCWVEEVALHRPQRSCMADEHDLLLPPLVVVLTVCQKELWETGAKDMFTKGNSRIYILKITKYLFQSLQTGWSICFSCLVVW